MKELGLKIKDIRTRLKVSQGDFANELSISRSGIAQIEAGKTNPSFELIHKIVKIYGINPDLFFDDLNLKNNNTDINVQVKTLNNVQDNDKIGISRNDLNILKEISWLPSVDEILPYLSNSETKNKAIFRDTKQEVKEKIQSYNSLAEIAELFRISTILENAKEFVVIDERRYIKGSIEDYMPEEYREGLKFDSPFLKTIIQILALKESVNHLVYLTDSRIKQLKRDCAFLLNLGIISINEKTPIKYKK